MAQGNLATAEAVCGFKQGLPSVPGTPEAAYLFRTGISDGIYFFDYILNPYLLKISL